MTKEDQIYINTVCEYAKINDITDFEEAARKYNDSCNESYIKFHKASKLTQEILIKQMAYEVYMRIKQTQHNLIIYNMLHYK